MKLNEPLPRRIEFVSLGGGSGGGGGGGAPTDATYVVGSASGSLSAELVLGTNVIIAGTLAARPAANTVVAGTLYIASDGGGSAGLGIMYRSDAATWDAVAIDKEYADALYQALDGDLTAIAALSGTGFATRTAANTWAQRSITVDSGLAVTNPAGVAGDPLIALDGLAIDDMDPSAVDIDTDDLVPAFVDGAPVTLTGTQLLGPSLFNLKTVYTPASASGPATLDFFEDTDNGTNRIRLTGPSSIASDRAHTIPDTASDTFAMIAATQTLTNKTLTAPTIGATEWTNAQHAHQAANSGGTLDHGLALTGLADDDHTNYANKGAQRTGDQTFEWSSSSGAATLYRSSSNANKGPHVFGSRVTMGSVAESLYASLTSLGADFVGAFGQIVGITASNFLTITASHYFWASAVGTTNATVTTLATIPIPTGSIMFVKAVIIARKDDESQSAKYERSILVRNNAGTITTDQAVTTIGTDFEAVAGWDATLDVSGTDVRLRVTGAAATNLEWVGLTDVFLDIDV